MSHRKSDHPWIDGVIRRQRVQAGEPQRCSPLPGSPLPAWLRQASAAARSFLAALTLLLLGSPTLAQAQRAAGRVAILPIAGDAAGNPAMAAAAASLLRDALSAEGYVSMPPEEVKRRLAKAGAPPCQKTDCAARTAKATRSSYAAALVVWEKGNRKPQVSISMLAVDGQSYPGSNAPHDEAFHDANTKQSADTGKASADKDATGKDFAWLRPHIRLAVGRAIERMRLGPGPWLRVEGTGGARVFVDGHAVGVVPHVMAILPGEHQVRVTLQDHAPLVRNVSIPLRDQREHRLDATLSKTGAGPSSGDFTTSSGQGLYVGPASSARASTSGASGAATSDTSRSLAEPRPLSASPRPRNALGNGLLAGGVLSAGLSLLIPGAVLLAKDGDLKSTRVENGDRINTFHDNKPGGTALVVTGSLLSVAAIGLAIWRPLRLEVGAAPTQGGAQFMLSGALP